MARSIRKIIAANIRKFRKRQGMSQDQLSRRAGLTSRYVSRIENDPQNVTVEVLERLARVLRVDPIELLGAAPPQHPPPEPPTTPSEAADQMIQLLQNYRAQIS